MSIFGWSHYRTLLSGCTINVGYCPVATGTPLGATQKEWDQRYREGVSAINRPWSELGDEPLVILFDHSDCGGDIAAKDCSPLADRMEQVLDLLPKKWDRDAEFYACTLQFIEGLRLAASRNEAVEFG